MNVDRSAIWLIRAGEKAMILIAVLNSMAKVSGAVLALNLLTLEILNTIWFQGAAKAFGRVVAKKLAEDKNHSVAICGRELSALRRGA